VDSEDYKKYATFVTGLSLAAYKKYSWGIEYEEAEQIGWIAFLRAKKDFLEDNNLKGNSNFESFVGQRVYGAVVDEVRKRTSHRKYKGDKSKRIPHVTQYIEDMSFQDIEKLGSCEISYQDISFNEIVSPLKNNYHVEVLRLVYVYEISKKEIADRFGVNQSRISHILKETLSKLRKCTENPFLVI